MKRLIGLCFFIVVTTALLNTDANAAEPALKLGAGLFQPDKEKNDATYRPLATFLSNKLNRPVELRTVDSWEGLAKSCTGGLIGHRLTQVPGASTYVDRVAVTDCNRAKVEMLGVPSGLLKRHGAVSADVAAAMARGIRERSGASVGVSVTGIAGPGGATESKPVGLVYVGLDGGPGEAMTKEFRFHGGDRTLIKQRSSQAALDLLRRWLIKKGC